MHKYESQQSSPNVATGNCLIFARHSLNGEAKQTARLRKKPAMAVNDECCELSIRLVH